MIERTHRKPGRESAGVFRLTAALLPLMTASCSTPSGERAAPKISASRVRDHITFLAHDELAGRGLGSDEIDIAAGYIAGQFAAMGILPGMADGTYIQTFETQRGGVIDQATELSFNDEEDFALGKDYQPLGVSSEGRFDAELVFAGYGIQNPDKDYDDYAGVDTEGRVVLMFRHEPPGWREGGYTRNAYFNSKARLAEEQGAAAVLIVNRDPGDEEDELSPFQLSRRGADIPMIHLARSVADDWLKRAGLPDLVTLQAALDKGDTSVNAPVPGIRVSGETAFSPRMVKVRNVVGILEGLGPARDEFVVIGGHYDHLGERGGQIYNGADDNASGTAGIIEVARTLALQNKRNRSALFIAFSAEESGLIGSRHFVRESPVAIESMVSMLNMDMIGRFNDADQGSILAAYGVGTGSSFESLVDHHGEGLGIALKKEQSANGPSDHAPFYNSGVPAMFFFTGIHDDYHRPEDDIDKIDWRGTARVIDFVAGIAVDLVNARTRPEYRKIEGRPVIYRQP